MLQDGHVDNVARFVRPGVVVLSWCEAAADPKQHAACVACERALANATDARGRRLRVTRLPMPPPTHFTAAEAEAIAGGARCAGDRIVTSYANFYIARGRGGEGGRVGVVVPGFGHGPSDDAAREILAAAFNEGTGGAVDVVMVPVGRAIALGGGNVHCITQQQPDPPK